LEPRDEEVESDRGPEGQQEEADLSEVIRHGLLLTAAGGCPWWRGARQPAWRSPAGLRRLRYRLDRRKGVGSRSVPRRAGARACGRRQARYSPSGGRRLMMMRNPLLPAWIVYGFSSLGQPTAFSVRYWNQWAPYHRGIVGNSSYMMRCRPYTASCCSASSDVD